MASAKAEANSAHQPQMERRLDRQLAKIEAEVHSGLQVEDPLSEVKDSGYEDARSS